MTENTFDKRAASWDKKIRRLELATAVASSIRELQLNKKMTAMEFGCGTGLVGLALCDEFASLTTVDSSEKMIEQVEKKIAEKELTNVTPCCQDITTAPLLSKFDIIFTSMTLHHIKNVDKALSTLYHHLNPNGILAIADLDEESGSFHEGRECMFTHSGFNREELTLKLQKIGFTKISFTTAHTIIREDKNGMEQPYNVFFMTAIRQA